MNHFTAWQLWYEIVWSITDTYIIDMVLANHTGCTYKTISSAIPLFSTTGRVQPNFRLWICFTFYEPDCFSTASWDGWLILSCWRRSLEFSWWVIVALDVILWLRASKLQTEVICSKMYNNTISVNSTLSHNDNQHYYCHSSRSLNFKNNINSIHKIVLLSCDKFNNYSLELFGFMFMVTEDPSQVSTSWVATFRMKVVCSDMTNNSLFWWLLLAGVGIKFPASLACCGFWWFFQHIMCLFYSWPTPIRQLVI